MELVLVWIRFLQGPEIPERQLYKEPPEAFLEADNMEEVGVATFYVQVKDDKCCYLGRF